MSRLLVSSILAASATASFVSPAASAENFWIPAEKFSNYSTREFEGELERDPDFDYKFALMLEDGEQVRIQLRADEELADYIEAHPDFELCALVANNSENSTNIRVKHFDNQRSSDYSVASDHYRFHCSETAPINAGNVLSAGVKVIDSNNSKIKVRGVSFRSTEQDEPETLRNALADYELSRALGYLWGDGGATTDGRFLTFRKTNFSVSKHFNSVATAAFGELATASGKYRVSLEEVSPQEFLERGPEEIADPAAFLTSVIETEGAVLVGRLADDPLRERCNYLKNLVNNMTQACRAEPCTDHQCEIPNCAFIARGNSRNQPDNGFANCGVYLSGEREDWKNLFSSDNYHFVKCDRTPGTQADGSDCTEAVAGSRPSYTE